MRLPLPRRTLRKMNPSSPDTATTTLDLRELGCGERHSLVLQCLSVLESGHAIVIINDHEPVPLRHQIAARFPNQIEWFQTQPGPREFRVTLRRLR